MYKTFKNNLIILLLSLIQEQETILKQKQGKNFIRFSQFKIKRYKLYTLFLKSNPLMYTKGDKIILSFIVFNRLVNEYDFVSNYKRNKKRSKNIRIIKSKISNNVW